MKILLNIYNTITGLRYHLTIENFIMIYWRVVIW